MPLRAYLVEDSPVILDLLTTTLTDVLGAEVVGSASGEADAVGWLKANDNWQLAVIDIQINDGSGYGVLKGVSPVASSKRLVVLSNVATSENRARAVAEGAHAVFDKSLQFDQFLAYCSAIEIA